MKVNRPMGNYSRALLYCLTLSFSLNTYSADENTAQGNDASKNPKILSQDKKTKIQETVLGMNVSGNKEAPNLLYIIPWKDSSEHSKPPEINRLMDEVFSTVDPDVYEKEFGFYQQLTQANKSTGTRAKD